MGVDVTSGPVTQLPDGLAAALGYVNWNPPYVSPSGPSALVSQTIYIAGIYLPVGKIVTNINIQVATAGSGTAPTGFYVGLCSQTKVLAQSSNIIGGGAEGQLKAVGTAVLPLSATYTTNYADCPNGNYYVAILANGNYASTSFQFERTAFVAGLGAALAGQGPLFGIAGTSQATLPANGGAITITQTTTPYWGVACS